MDSVFDRQKDLAVIYDYWSFGATTLLDNLRCTLGIEFVGVINYPDNEEAPDWLTQYESYSTAISDFMRTGFWPVLLSPTSKLCGHCKGDGEVGSSKPGGYDTIKNCRLCGGSGRKSKQYLTDYEHPPKAVYIVGPDNCDADHALPEKLISLCNDVVTVPSDDRELHAISALVCSLWDRHVKNSLVSYYYNNRS